MTQVTPVKGLLFIALVVFRVSAVRDDVLLLKLAQTNVMVDRLYEFGVWVLEIINNGRLDSTDE
jgi:hypothetical protein